MDGNGPVLHPEPPRLLDVRGTPLTGARSSSPVDNLLQMGRGPSNAGCDPPLSYESTDAEADQGIDNISNQESDND
jgi:hypothetical protein